MKEIKSFIVLIAMVLSLIGCTTQMGISNGAFSDISLVRSSENYSIKRLKEVKESGKSIFGIPLNPSKNKQGFIFRFNGINLNAANGFLPILSMILFTAPTSIFINSLAGSTYNSDYTKKNNLGLVLSTLIAIPVTGAINNFIWSGSAYKTATFNVNSILLEENPTIDIFLNPKYEIDRKDGLWTQNATIKARVMGATIKVDEDLTTQTIDIKNKQNEALKTKDITYKQNLKSQRLITFNYPANASLLIDKLSANKTPFTVPLTYGEHKILLTQANNKLEKTIIISDIDTDTSFTLNFANNTKDNIESLSNKIVGTTSTNSNSNDNIKIAESSTPKSTGRTVIFNYPNDAKFYIDGKIVVGTPYSCILTYGNHIIYMMQDEKTLRKKITIKEKDKDSTFTFDFE